MTSLSSTSTLTVNAAFLQEIKEVNRDLWRLLDELRQLCSTPEALRSKRHEFLNRLEELRDQLALHFALEEAYGYFEDPVDVAPRLCEQAHALRSEHRALYVQVCELVERAAPLRHRRHPRGLEREVCSHFSAFDDQLRRHESREVELILQEYDDDLGVGD